MDLPVVTYEMLDRLEALPRVTKAIFSQNHLVADRSPPAYLAASVQVDGKPITIWAEEISRILTGEATFDEIQEDR